MARPPHARERILDAYQALLISEGERSATLDAVARSAAVSKGGLLYHFASKDDLVQALIQRLERLVAEDVTAMSQAETGPVEYYLRSSMLKDDPLDRAIIAVARLAQGGSHEATQTLHRMRREWSEAIRPRVRDQASLDLVLLVSDGLFFNNTVDTATSAGVLTSGSDLDALITLVRRSVENSSDPASDETQASCSSI